MKTEKTLAEISSELEAAMKLVGKRIRRCATFTVEGVSLTISPMCVPMKWTSSSVATFFQTHGYVIIMYGGGYAVPFERVSTYVTNVNGDRVEVRSDDGFWVADGVRFSKEFVREIVVKNDRLILHSDRVGIHSINFGGRLVITIDELKELAEKED